MALKVAPDRVVKLAYRITDKEGRVLDERTPAQGYEYLHGHGQIVAPVERRLEGKTAGFGDEVFVTPREAYGEYQTGLVAELTRDHFPPSMDIQVGMKFSTKDSSGNEVTVRVIEVDDETVTVDGNHPLAGLDLIFDVKVLGVREASADELAVGRVGAEPGSTGGLQDDDDDGGGILH